MERRQIVELWREPGTASGVAGTASGVLITLVHAEGSTYRRPGARLLTAAMGSQADARGLYAGTISGGCLESEVVRRARWMVRAGAVVERYSMAFDDTAEIPFGLGCGGTVDLLFEPAGAPEAEALFQAMSDSLAGVESIVVSFLPGGGRGLRRVVYSADGRVVFASEGLDAKKIDCARALEPGGEYEGRYVERLFRPQRLVILGAGDDAKPLAAMASSLGWSVLVADGRAQLARAERFPHAEQVLVLDDPDQLQIEPQDAVVLMTHSYEQDRTLLSGLLASPRGPRYLGMLGSRHRSSLLVSEAAAMTGRSVSACCETVFAPVGLDLGGDGPEAIALAIVAEVQAFRHGRLSVSRKLTPGEVAEQLERGGSSRYLQAQCALGAAE
ncbi:Xanthine and CO dehydrogenase maturation factor, XdhC/CoxF family [Granulicella rosea]|uniref:Xanthine and CO dehydrogenase maturation factor, XdhC/CoxF family n=2 Tax=Granulicella rosea TaxID=474952 RepID=A0A239KTS8_9BACT|nr:Xanthine and CO dehydrogenase maturation factor, XdhC/CoxF family [Granulicella rosea]